MTGPWSLQSSAQLFTQKNLHAQQAPPKRAHRGNKVGPGADDYASTVSERARGVHGLRGAF